MVLFRQITPKLLSVIINWRWFCFFFALGVTLFHQDTTSSSKISPDFSYPFPMAAAVERHHEYLLGRELAKATILSLIIIELYTSFRSKRPSKVKNYIFPIDSRNDGLTIGKINITFSKSNSHNFEGYPPVNSHHYEHSQSLIGKSSIHGHFR